jgi:Polyketide cyclase / dehydrase and lipid transport
MLQTILILLALAVLVIAVLAARKPDTFRVARTARINASPDKIFPLINDLRAMNTWNTFSLRDPSSKTSYSGPASGVGAQHAFDGPKSGGGTIEITEVDAPNRATMRLQMTRPIKADNVVTFTLARAGSATDVTWAMEGRSPFFIKVMTLFFNHDGMMHQAFDEGLMKLKELAEKA